jgi:pyrroloquinoline quinone biosynthesis protein E
VTSRSRLHELQQRAFERCIPLNATIEITLRCNLRCVHCYNFDRDLPYLPLAKREEELADEEILRIIDELRDEGTLYLAFSGGEALVHPQLTTFVRHASASGLMVTVKTNGTLFEPARVAELADAGCADVEVSVYGATPEVHDSFVKMEGALSRTIAGAQAARDAGLGVKLSFVVVQRNAGEVGRMIDLADSLGLPYGIDPQITARYDGSRESLDLRVDKETLERLYRHELHHLVPPAAENPSSVQCSCARSVVGISAFGEVYPCIGAPVPSGSLRKMSFHQIWTESQTLNWIRGLRLDDFAACKSCEHLKHCRRSSGVIFANTGVYNGPVQLGDDWTCMEAEVIHRIHDEAPDAPAAPRGAGKLRRHSKD